jgi:drug/metabolite transporter (DMT)-like permease
VRLIPLTAILLAVIFWGLTPVAVRYLVGFLDPVDLLVIRFSLSALIFLPLLWGLRVRYWSRNEFVLLAVCSLAAVAGYNVPVTYGAQWVPAGLTGLLITTEPIWIVLISMLALRRRPDWTLLLGLAVAAAGVAVLLSSGDLIRDGGDSFVLGCVLILLGAFMWAVYCVLVPPLARKYGAMKSTASVQTVGVIPLVFLWQPGLAERAALLHCEAWLAIGFLVIFASALAVGLWNLGLSRLGSAHAGVFLYLIPLVTVLAGALVLGEQVGTRELLSGAMIVSGVAIAQLRPASRYTEANAPSRQ